MSAPWNWGPAAIVAGIILFVAGLLGGHLLVPPGDDPWVSVWYVLGFVGALAMLAGAGRTLIDAPPP